MSIKDKDGNVYKLFSPNPIITSQNSWDNRYIKFHNMSFPSIEETNRRAIIPEGIYDPPPAPVEEEVPTEPNPKRSQKLDKLIEDRKIKLLCLPVKNSSYEDTLYGTKYSRVQFGQKTMITGVIISAEDLLFIFWTEIPVKEKSIVFPTQTDMKRWWQIDKCEPQSDGFLISCSPSTISPDFSD